MLILKKADNQISIELPKTAFHEAEDLDLMIAQLQSAKEYLTEFRGKMLEEATQPLWEDSL